jgi:hypothetical protein
MNAKNYQHLRYFLDQIQFLEVLQGQLHKVCCELSEEDTKVLERARFVVRCATDRFDCPDCGVAVKVYPAGNCIHCGRDTVKMNWAHVVELEQQLAEARARLNIGDRVFPNEWGVK